MTRRIYHLYLCSCLHFVKARPRQKTVWCPDCGQFKEGVDVSS